MAEVQVKEGAVESINFFGKDDMNRHGRIASEAPAWTFPQHKEKLEDDITIAAGRLERGEIPESHKPAAMAELKQMREKLDRINEATPRFSGAQKDIIAKVRETVGEEISKAMFTKKEMRDGLADAHEEARRMADPCIKLKDREAVILAKKAGCRVTPDGQVSRTDAERLWKFTGRSLGERSNTEALRRG